MQAPEITHANRSLQTTLKEEILALTKVEGPLTEGQEPDFLQDNRCSVQNPAAFPSTWIILDTLFRVIIAVICIPHFECGYI